MITLICLVSSLTILMLSAKTYKDLQEKITEAEQLTQELKTKKQQENALTNSSYETEELV